MTHRKQDFLFGAIGMAASLAAIWLSVQYPSDSALFPLLSASGIFICSLAVLIMVIKSKEGSEKVEGINLRSAAMFAAVLLLYVFFIEKAGFFTSSFFFVMVVSMVWGRFGKGVSLRFSLLFAALFTVFLYITFVKIFTVPLPKGLLF